MLGQVHGQEALKPIAAIFHLSADGLGPVAALALRLEMADGRDGFGAKDQRHARAPLGDGVAKLSDQMLWPLPAGHFQDRMGRIGPDALCHCTGHIVGAAKGRHGSGGRDFKLPDRRDQIDVSR